MRSAIEQHPRIITNAESDPAGGRRAVRSIWWRHRRCPVDREGLPTPNIFTGGQNYHSLREWASVQDMAAAAATVVELVRVWGE
jgi:tripeptide aminopeptidase